jgi:hypothetical protein
VAALGAALQQELAGGKSVHLELVDPVGLVAEVEE